MRTRFVMAALATAAIVVVVLLLVWPRLATRGPEPSGNALPSAVDPRAASSASPSLAVDQSAPPSRRDAIALPATFRIVVVDVARRPIADAAVLAWCDGDAVFSEHRSDADGAIVLPARAANGGLVAVQRDGAIGLGHPIAWRSEHTLVVGDGATLTGSVTVAGQAAPADLVFALTTTDFGLPVTAPDAVHERLQELAGTRRLVTAAGGTFAVAGLLPAWRGTLTAPAGHWFAFGAVGADGLRWLRSLTPGHRVVELVRLPSIRGSVRWTDGSPVRSGGVGVRAECVGGTEVAGQAQVDDEGRFVIGLEPRNPNEREAWARASSYPQLERGTLSCGGVYGLVDAVEIPLGAAALTEDVAIVLTRADDVHFVVVDGRGAPIRGARVSVEGSEPTDAAGRSRYVGKPPRLVGAPDHAVVAATPIEGVGSATSPLRFVLPAVNRLTIEVVGPEGPAPAGLEVVLMADAPMMAGRQEWRALHGTFGGSECSNGSARSPNANGGWRQQQLLTSATDARGRVVLHSLEPGLRGRLVVRDRKRDELGGADFVLPAFGESSQLVVRLASAMVRVRGIVVRSDGEPVALPEVALVGPSGHAGSLAVGRGGRFAEWMRRENGRFDLRVGASGMVSVVRNDVLRGDGDVGQIRLLPGRSVTVHVVDESGQPVDLFAQPVGHEHVQQQNLGVGVWGWPEMPSEVVFYVTVSGRRFEMFAGPGDDEVVLRATPVAKVWLPKQELPAEAKIDAAAACVLLHALADLAAPPERLWFWPNADDARPVLPGRYRAELARWRTLPDGTVHVEGLGITRDLELRAGQTVEIRF